MNIQFNQWREECLSSLVENDELFVCVSCMIRVKHPIYHYIRWHKVRPFPCLRLKRWTRKAYVKLYNYTFDIHTKLIVSYMRWSYAHSERESKSFKFTSKRTKYWEELLELERNMLNAK